MIGADPRNFRPGDKGEDEPALGRLQLVDSAVVVVGAFGQRVDNLFDFSVDSDGVSCPMGAEDDNTVFDGMGEPKAVGSRMRVG